MYYAECVCAHIPHTYSVWCIVYRYLTVLDPTSVVPGTFDRNINVSTEIYSNLLVSNPRKEPGRQDGFDLLRADTILDAETANNS
jgi:hypothetical protein